VVLDGRLFLKGQDDDDDDKPEPRPRLSIPLGDDDDDDDDDDSLLLPPLRSAELAEDDNLTQRSVELPRRAIREQLGGPLRGSFGSIRTSDRFGDLNELELELDAFPIEGPESSFIEQGDFLDHEENANESLIPRYVITTLINLDV
jgi:hypothetical protein